MINAYFNLILATADCDDTLLTTAVICLLDMFTSEVCLFHSEKYFQGFITESSSEHGSSVVLKERSLASEWGANSFR